MFSTKKIKTYNLEKDANLVDFDKNCLIDLTSEEASFIFGGLKIVNDSGSTRRFYNFGENVVPQSQTLQPNQEGNYGGEYILYNTSKTGFEPALIKVDPTQTASFIEDNNAIKVDPNRRIFRY